MQIDRLPASTLTSRYNIGRTTLHERIKALSLQPHKEGNRAFFTPDQVALLDALAEHINQGGTTPEFVRTVHPEQSAVQLSAPFTPNVHPEQSEQWLRLFELMAARFAPFPPSPPDPLRLHRQLEEISLQGWIVTTAQLKAVLGYAPTPGDRYGFRFIKVGRQGMSMGWQIQKIPLSSGMV